MLGLVSNNTSAKWLSQETSLLSHQPNRVIYKGMQNNWANCLMIASPVLDTLSLCSLRGKHSQDGLLLVSCVNQYVTIHRNLCDKPLCLRSANCSKVNVKNLLECSYFKYWCDCMSEHLGGFLDTIQLVQLILLLGDPSISGKTWTTLCIHTSMIGYNCAVLLKCVNMAEPNVQYSL